MKNLFLVILFGLTSTLISAQEIDCDETLDNLVMFVKRRVETKYEAEKEASKRAGGLMPALARKQRDARVKQIKYRGTIEESQIEETMELIKESCFSN